ncbi:hemerythrin domain-containing protein [Nocardia panacis]|uniref:Hemerythrin domain-containing protein n=1 Tax=Nocardia panacis TaxID=2340916 RepID=A0A3A4KBH1_9NOCA|nr:hemerythrin domain-containing protein [Nocardia panacis]RJO70800.1 hemerythrin domain-containing protein [Nocardia panacis]
MHRDVVELLTEQHEQIRTLLDRLQSQDETADRRTLFAELVRLLVVHESAEEIVVHPVVRRGLFGVEDHVKPRIAEEKAAKLALAELYDLGVDHSEFDIKLADFAESMREHMAREEAGEFTVLRTQISTSKLERMTGSMRWVEAVMPTRPHPHAGETAVANLFAGPPLALFDKARDALRDWLRTQDL